MRRRGIPSCQGCWDEDIIDGLNACECSYPSQLAERRGHRAHHWTADTLTEENKAFLAELPMTLQRDKLLFVHGSPNNQHEYLLPDMNAFAALERVETAGAEMMFCGHTHKPYVRDSEAAAFASRCSGGAVELPRNRIQLPMRRIVNAGSVGEPRHGSTKSTYVVHNDDTGAVTIREVDYNVDKTCQAIVQAGLPEVFAWRLSHGFEYAERAEDASPVCER